MSNETKIGLMATVIIAAFIWGFKFIQGKNLFSQNNIFYVEYDDVSELQASAPIFKNGLQVGTVADISFKGDDMDKVIVTLDIDGDLKVPKTATANLVYMGVMGGRGVYLNFSKPCSGDDCAQSGDYLNAVGKGLLGSLVDPNEIPEYLEQLSSGAKDMLKQLNNALADPNSANDPMVKMVNNLSKTLENLSTTTAELNNLMAGSAGPLKRTLQNVEGLTANLNNNNDKITAVLANAETMTAKFSDLDLKPTIDKTNGTIDGAKQTMADLSITLKKANTTFDGINKLLAGIEAGEGTIGKLAKDKEMYEKLNATLREVELLMQDVRLHPKRYTRILGKKETPYEAPVNDPAKMN